MSLEYYSKQRSRLPATLQSLPGPDDIARVELPNGIVVLARPNFNSPSVVLRGFLQAGSLLDPDEKLGLVDFTIAALMRGTAQRSHQQIYDTLEGVGASLGLNSATHTTGFGGRALAEDLDLLLELLAEVLYQPAFPPEQVERLRAQLLTGLAIRNQDTGDMASLAFDQIVYRGHPYSRPDDGYPETVQAIQREDLVAFHQQQIGPRGMVIVIVGAVDPQQAVARVAEIFGGWENPAQTEPPALPPVTGLEQTTSQQVSIPGKFQADIVIGASGPPRSAPDFVAASLGNNILGQFGMMGRVGEAVREKAGLAYYAHSSLSGGYGPGPWTVSAGVNPVNVERAVELIRAEIARFVEHPVSDEELADSQANFVGRLPLALESNGGVAGAILRLERYNLGLDYYWHYPEMVQSITAQEVLEAARRYLDPERLAIASAGP